MVPRKSSTHATPRMRPTPATSSNPLFIDFANSELYDGRGNREDRLRDPEWWGAFLERWQLGSGGPANRVPVPALFRLRAAIRSIAKSLWEGKRPVARDLQSLNRALAQNPMRFQLSWPRSRPELAPVPIAGRGAFAVAGEIALSAARFLAEEEPERLKLCDNTGCQWVFFDRTRNRGRRWCRQCGNVDKVRRFRERQRRRAK